MIATAPIRSFDNVLRLGLVGMVCMRSSTT
jgi:hypothetical protein